MKFTQQDVTLLEQNNIIPKGTPPPQVQYFLKVCEQAKMNPVLKQIHMVERRSKDYNGTWIKSYTIQAGLGGMRAIAQRNGKIFSIERGTLYKDNLEGVPILYGFCKVTTVEGGTYYDEVPFSEYVQTKNDGKPNKFWKQFPETMIKKVAEESVLRMIAPEDLSGIYGDTEMLQDNGKDKLAETKKELEEQQKLIGEGNKEKIKANSKKKTTRKVKNTDKKKTGVKPKSDDKAKWTLKQVESALKGLSSPEQLIGLWTELTPAQKEKGGEIWGWFEAVKAQFSDASKEAEKEKKVDLEKAEAEQDEIEEAEIVDDISADSAEDIWNTNIKNITNMKHYNSLVKKHQGTIVRMEVEKYQRISMLLQEKETKLSFGTTGYQLF